MGGVISIVIKSGVDEAEILPSESVDVTVIELTPSLSSDDDVIEKFPSTSVTAVSPVLIPLIERFIILPASDVPSIVGVVSFVAAVVVVIDGAIGAVVSISIVNPADSADSFPAASVDLTVIKLFPSSSDEVGDIAKFPLLLDKTESPVFSPLTYRVTRLLASALPTISGVVSFVNSVVVVIDGVLGAVISISIVIPEDAADSFPAASVAVTVRRLSPSGKVSVKVKVPSVAVISPTVVSPLSKVTVLPASAVPVIVWVTSLVRVPAVSIFGTDGGVVSISIVNPSDAADSFPNMSVALTVIM